MSKMLDRVTQAVIDAVYEAMDPEGGIQTSAQCLRPVAVAAIKAMRNPPKSIKTLEGLHWSDVGGCSMCGGIREGWQKIIDETLK